MRRLLHRRRLDAVRAAAAGRFFDAPAPAAGARDTSRLITEGTERSPRHDLA
jgi:hypothetical protein